MILNADSPVFELESGALKARVRVGTGQFTVLTGSEVQVGGGLNDETRRRQQQLIERGHLKPSDRPGIYRLTEPTRFATADEATRVVLGRAGDASSLWTFTAPDGKRTTYGAWLDTRGADQAAQTPPRFELGSVGVTATAEVRGGQFVVLKGSGV